MIRTVASLAACTLLLGACGTTGSGLSFTTDSYCQIAKPVRVSRQDTRMTKEQADIEYRKYMAACGKQ